MSFKQKAAPAPVDPGPAPNPADTANRVMSARRRRLAGGGTQSTFLGGMMSPGLAAPTKTGVGG